MKTVVAADELSSVLRGGDAAERGRAEETASAEGGTAWDRRRSDPESRDARRAWKGTPVATLQHMAIEFLRSRPDGVEDTAAIAAHVEAKLPAEGPDREPLPSRPEVERWRHYLWIALSKSQAARWIERDSLRRWRLTEIGRTVDLRPRDAKKN
jgi:hypothetical protein